jgi:hypothetical protein
MGVTVGGIVEVIDGFGKLEGGAFDNIEGFL